MAHLHSVYDTDSHFSIDPITRTIKNESPKKVTVMQYDHNSERFTFEVTRYIEGHDMSICNRVEVHYQNGDTKGVYEVNDLQVYPEDENIVVCSWLISQNCTKFAAALDFRLTFKCIADDGTTLDYIWSTAMHKGISVSAGISNSDAVVEQYADVLEEWEQILFDTGGTADIEQMKKDIADLKRSLPEVTEGDNGKFLQAMDGKWVAADVTPQMTNLVNEIINQKFIPISQADYDALVSAGTVDESKYYMIEGGNE